MRLTCPNCAAQYEVAPEAIPPQGRDVQCSACGQTWFERPAAEGPEADPEAGIPRVENDPEEADDLAEMEASPPPVPPTLAAPPTPAAAMAPVPPAAAAAAAVPPVSAPPEAPAAPPPSAAERQRVPPEVERILREEAQHEARVRAEEVVRRAAAGSEPSPVPPIGRPASAPPRGEVIDVPVAVEPEPPPEAPAARPQAPAPLVRPARPARPMDRELDIDRINSTLRSQADQLGARAPRVEGAPAASRRRGSGFGGGFWGALLVIALLAAVYVYRGQIVQAVPAAAAVLDPYAEAVETGRDWLDRQVARLLGAETPPG